MQDTAGFIPQRFQVSAGKTGDRMCRVPGFRPYLIHAVPVAGTRHGQFSVDRVTFFIGIHRVQQRLCQRIRQPFCCTFQGIIFNFKIEIGIVGAGAGVMASAVLRQIVTEVPGFREAFRAHQHHMLQIVRKTRLALRLIHTADSQTDCRR